jgi:hypothetical protein
MPLRQGLKPLTRDGAGGAKRDPERAAAHRETLVTINADLAIDAPRQDSLALGD